MKVIEKYTGEKTYMFPSGNVADPETVKAKYPAATVFVHIVETDDGGEVMYALQNLSAMRSAYGIDKSLSEEEAISAIEEIINTPATDGVSDETRIADALEDMVVLQELSTVEV